MKFGVDAPWYNDPVERVAFNLYAMDLSRLDDIASEIVSQYGGQNITDDDIRDLYNLNDDELNYVSNSIIKQMDNDRMKKTQENALGHKYKDLSITDRKVDKLNQRLYYTIKQKYHKKHPEIIPTQKNMMKMKVKKLRQ